MLIVRIHNDGTGTERSSNYEWDVAITTRSVDGVLGVSILSRGRIEGHDRSQAWDKLVSRVAGREGQEIPRLRKRKRKTLDPR